MLVKAEKAWRALGAIVILDPSGSGIWLFGNRGRVEFILKSSTEALSENILDLHGNSLQIHKEGDYDPSTLIAPAPALSPSSTNARSATNISASASMPNNRLTQTPNLMTTQNNTLITTSQEQANQNASTTIALSNVPTLLGKIHELFLSAILGSLNFGLCELGGYIPLNARSLIIPCSNTTSSCSSAATSLPACRHIISITLDIHMTTLNTLVVKASSMPTPGLDWMQAHVSQPGTCDFSQGTELFLGPSGRLASYQGILPPIGESAVRDCATPSGASIETNLERWQHACIAWLVRKGIDRDMLASTSWAIAHIPQQHDNQVESDEEDLSANKRTWTTVLWPAVLCFRHNAPTSFGDPQSCQLDDYNPLKFSETWFASKIERDQILSQKQKEREAADALLHSQAETNTKVPPSNKFLNRNLRRSSNTGAVYPTPPDGVQNAVGATPLFEEHVQTPGLLTHAPTSFDATDAMNITNDGIDGSGATEDTSWDTSDAKQELPTSGLDFNSEDIFDDMDGDLFGENNITDADFSFFDEPDALDGREKDVAESQHASDHEVTSQSKAPIVASTSDDFFDTDAADRNDISTAVTPALQAVKDDNGTDPPILDESQPEGLDNGLEIDIFTNKLVSPPPVSPKNAIDPLSPGTVFKRLIEVNDGKGPETTSYGGFKFDPSLSSFSAKYGAHGRFDSPASPRSLLHKAPANLPKTEYLSRRRKGLFTKDEWQSPLPKTPLSQALQTQFTDSQSDADSSDDSPHSSPPSSRDGIPDASSDGMYSRSHHKRKRGLDDDDEYEIHDVDMTSSFQDLQVESGQSPLTVDIPVTLSLAELEPDPAEWSLTRYFASTEPYGHMGTFPDTDYIAMAQILADQAIYMTLQVPSLIDRDVASDLTLSSIISSKEDAVHQNLRKISRRIFENTAQCSTASYLEIQDVKTFTQVHRLPPRPTPNMRGSAQNPDVPRALLSLQSPHLEVRRAETKLSVLPSAIPFWETLGLGPCKGPKDICAICVCPSSKGITENAEAFLDHLERAYESNHFGTHERFIQPIFTYEFTPADLVVHAPHTSTGRSTLPAIRDVIARIGKELVANAIEDKNAVVYWVYDPVVPEILLHICSAFHDLFNIYRDALSAAKIPISNELVLQLIPIGLVASTTSLVIPPPSAYARLAQEVYDRSVDLKTGTASPSVVLERSLPRMIDFKLTPNPSASLMQENSAMHVAYSQSIDERWVTAAWTDNAGNMQMTASYCLGHKDGHLTTAFTSIADEIWQTTIDIISSRKVNWRIMIARCGVMVPSELNHWRKLAAAETSAQLSLTLITVDTKPSLQIIPPKISLAPAIISGQSAFYGTSVTTPSASILSPEQSGNASTPAGDAGVGANASTPDSHSEIKIESDAFLIDLTEQSWGAILSHSLNNSNSLLESNPALVSGYLIKRSGTAPSDPPIVIEINVVHTEVNPRVYEALLREIIGVYRGLATLARARGCVDHVKDGRPWHIAAAEKGVHVLYMLM